MPEVVTQKLCVTGQVQGVGFRPFVYRLAKEFGITGWVRNCAGTVEILAQSDTNTLQQFRERLTRSAPPFAVPKLTSLFLTPQFPSDTFDILDSDNQTASDVHLPVDQFVCPDCLVEMQDPGNRRYRYPFINCTQCGPRYTLIDRLPYDRSNTSMAAFAMCAECRVEYHDVSDRRFHAEPIACPRCGPGLVYVDGKSRITDTESAVTAVVNLLRGGGIVAVRGIGGYHLLCDACNELAVINLRQRKHRPHKPLAVMVPQCGDDLLDGVRAIVAAQPEHERLLVSPRRPIVLCDRNQASPLAASIAPQLNEVGVFLPYSPLHHMILDAFGGPLVATSGNISGEPVLTDESEAEQRLATIVDGFLHHNRGIRRPADDAVFQFGANRMRPLRLGRGYAPLELQLNGALAKPTLAVGGHMKNTVGLAWRDRLVISPHIGDLDSLRSTQVFQQVIEDFQRVYDVEPELIVCDAHPDYASTRWAKRLGKVYQEVYHHHAHASAVFGEFASNENILVFTWDGTGYGEDGSIWGGEGLYGAPGNWQRLCSFRSFRLPGGDMAARHPWRAAAALCWDSGIEFPCASLNLDLELAKLAWQKNLNTPITTSAGRLFDAAAYLIGTCPASTSFEGQAPMYLEAAACKGPNVSASALPLERDETGCWRADWQELIGLCTDRQFSVAERAALFHEKAASTLLDMARRVHEDTGVKLVGLSGGVFQNKILLERAHELLTSDGFTVLMPERIPVNDAGISFGQLVEAAALNMSTVSLQQI